MSPICPLFFSLPSFLAPFPVPSRFQAMALDGFCSFVANLALAARVHQAPRWLDDARLGVDDAGSAVTVWVS